MKPFFKGAVLAGLLATSAIGRADPIPIQGSVTGQLSDCAETVSSISCGFTGGGTSMWWGPNGAGNSGQRSTLSVLSPLDLGSGVPLAGIQVGGFAWMNNSINGSGNDWPLSFSYTLTFGFTTPDVSNGNVAGPLAGDQAFTILNDYAKGQGNSKFDANAPDVLMLPDLGGLVFSFPSGSGTFLVSDFSYELGTQSQVCTSKKDNEGDEDEKHGNDSAQQCTPAGSLDGFNWTLAEGGRGELKILADISFTSTTTSLLEVCDGNCTAAGTVPEPGTLSSLGLGAFAMSVVPWLRRRRRRR